MTQIFRWLLDQAAIFKNKKRDFSIGGVIESPAFWTPIIIFCCLILTATASYQATKGLIEDNERVFHTQEVIEQILNLSFNLTTAESRQRGYLITGDKLYLDNYHQSLQQVEQHLQDLKALTIDNPAQQSRLQRLQILKERRIAALQKVLDSYRNYGPIVGKMAFLENAGLQKMNEFKQLIDQFYTEEKKLLKARSITSAQSKGKALNSLIIGGIFSATLVLFSYYLIINDLRRRKQAAKELAEARDNLEEKVMVRTLELEQSNRELNEFAFIASHDLQEPLRKIQVFGDRLRQKSNSQLDNAALDYLDRMQNAAKRMHRLINDLLAFSRVSNNQGAIETVDLNLIVKEMLSDLEGSIDHYGGHVQTRSLPVVIADPLQMLQLFQNITSNALKFHRPAVSPEVSIIWQNETSFEAGQATEKFYEIAITDNGIGIDQQYIDKIFVPFQRLHGKSEYEGTGIGLAVCRKIVERHNGYIRVMAAPSGQGTVFIIGLPVTV